MSASNPHRPGDTDQATNLIFTTVGRPLRSASLFYTLLYLVDVAGVEAAAFDFKQIREELEAGFFWYGIYTIFHELSHIFDRYFVDGFQVSRYVENAEVNINPDPFGETIEEELNVGMMRQHSRELVDDPDLEGLSFDLFQHSGDLNRARPFSQERTFGAVQHFLEIADLHFNFIDTPEASIRLADQVFRNSSTRFEVLREIGVPEGFTRQQWEEFGTNARIHAAAVDGWISQEWNGPGWTGVAEHLRRRNEFSETAWVDQSWSIEHNNQKWIDKVGFRDSEAEVFRVVLMEDPFFPEPTDQMILNDGLVPILDAAQATDLEELFRWAVNYNDEVDVNLRRLQRRFT